MSARSQDEDPFVDPDSDNSTSSIKQTPSNSAPQSPPSNSARSAGRPKQVKFTSKGEELDHQNKRHSRHMDMPATDEGIEFPTLPAAVAPRARPNLDGRTFSAESAVSESGDGENSGYVSISLADAMRDPEKMAIETMDERDARLARMSMGSRSAPGSAASSPHGSPTISALAGNQGVPLLNLDFTGEDKIEEENEAGPSQPTGTAEAHKLIRAHTKRIGGTVLHFDARDTDALPSGAQTPMVEKHEDYIPAPAQYREGVLSSLLKLYQEPSKSYSEKYKSHSRHTSGAESPSSGYSTPKWYKSAQNSSTASLLAQSSAALAAHAGTPMPSARPSRPKMKSRSVSGGILSRISRPQMEDEIRITIHIAQLLQRQRYLLKLCRALMLYGAPTHRLESYLNVSSRILEVDAQYLYIPGCMLVSFDDASTHTSDMRLVRVAQSLDLGKLQDTHLIYKEVVHDVISVDDGIQRLDELLSRKPKHSAWFLVFVYGCASASVGPLFGARPIDLPICFLLGAILGFLALIVAPMSDLYSNVFEIVAAVVTSFLARAFGSIRPDDPLFCFSGIAQASIALILPGYIILCGALELQSKNLVAGSVRMFYAIIYSLLLGFGITIGSALWGLIDSNATSATNCENILNPYYKFAFVGPFTLCLLIANQAHWRQAPIQLLISLVGYTVNFFAGRKFKSSVEVANFLGAFAIGVMGNVYSRFSHQIAFTAMVPAIFLQVPSGLASQGSLISGLQTADSLVNSTVTLTTQQLQDDYSSTLATLTVSTLRVAIGISVGLFVAAIAVYPLGKKRSGLFSF